MRAHHRGHHYGGGGVEAGGYGFVAQDLEQVGHGFAGHGASYAGGPLLGIRVHGLAALLGYLVAFRFAGESGGVGVGEHLSEAFEVGVIVGLAFIGGPAALGRAAQVVAELVADYQREAVHGDGLMPGQAAVHIKDIAVAAL